jgi:hypothetical protein
MSDDRPADDEFDDVARSLDAMSPADWEAFDRVLADTEAHIRAHPDEI